MSAESLLVAAFEADSPPFTSVYLQEAPQGAALPYVCYEVVSSVPVEAPAAGEEINETVIDVAYYAETLTEAKQLAERGRDILIDQLDAAVIENTQDQRDRDTRRKAVVQTYRIWHVEDFP